MDSNILPLFNSNMMLGHVSLSLDILFHSFLLLKGNFFYFFMSRIVFSMHDYVVADHYWNFFGLNMLFFDFLCFWVDYSNRIRKFSFGSLLVSISLLKQRAKIIKKVIYIWKENKICNKIENISNKKIGVKTLFLSSKFVPFFICHPLDALVKKILAS